MAGLPRTAGISRLTYRREFLAVQGARRKWATPGFILQVRAHDARCGPRPGEAAIRIGLTTSKKIGNAVKRSRARRRLRHLAADLLPRHALPGHDYVLIGRGGTLSRPWTALQADLLKALAKLRCGRTASPAPHADGDTTLTAAGNVARPADPAAGHPPSPPGRPRPSPGG